MSVELGSKQTSGAFGQLCGVVELGTTKWSVKVGFADEVAVRIQARNLFFHSMNALNGRATKTLAK